MALDRFTKTYFTKILTAAFALMLVAQVSAFAQVSGVPDMPYPRVGMCSARIENTVYFIGGAQGLQGRNIENIRGTSTVQAFNFGSNSWETNIAPLLTPRVFACAVALDDSIYVMGGVDSLGNVLNTVEVYDPASNKWHYTASMKYERKGAAATTFDGRILVFGGGDSANILHKEVETYNPDDEKWTVLPNSMLFGRAFHQVARVGNSIYIFGGVGGSIGPVGFIERYVPLVGVVSLGLTWRDPRAFFGTVVEQDSVYVISGYGSNMYPGGCFPDIRTFEFPSPDSIVEKPTTAVLDRPRRGFVAARGNDGSIYLFGGVSPNYKNGQVPVASVYQVPQFVTPVIENPLPNVPKGYSLDQNYPNPFNPTTTIHFDVPSPGSRVSLDVYNMLGQKVKNLVNGILRAGSYNAVFNGANLPSGAYIYRLETEKGSLYRKMVLIK